MGIMVLNTTDYQQYFSYTVAVKNLYIKTNIVKKQKCLSNENLTKWPTLLGGTGLISDLGPKIKH